MTETTDPRLVWAGKLADQVERQINGRRLAAHLFARLTVLLHAEELQFVQVTTEINRHFVESGDLRVWTNRHLAIVRYDNVAISGPGMRPSTLDNHSESTVDVKLVPRSALRGIAVPATAPDGTPVNDGSSWNSEINDGNWSWPMWGTLILTYDGLDQPLALPGKGDVDALNRMIPSLLDDLAAS